MGPFSNFVGLPFCRQDRQTDNGNYLESGEVRGNMSVALSDEK